MSCKGAWPTSSDSDLLRTFRAAVTASITSLEGKGCINDHSLCLQCFLPSLGDILGKASNSLPSLVASFSRVFVPGLRYKSP